MVFPIAMALMGAAVARKGKEDEQDQIDREAERSARAEDRAALRTDRAFQQSERARMAANRDRVAAASAPVEPTDGTVYQPEVDDEGNPMPANPTAGTFKVGEQRFNDLPTAQAAGEVVRRKRMSTAMEQGGDFHGAQQLRTGAVQEQAAQMQVDEAQRKFANARFDETMGQVGSFDDLAGMISKMNGSATGIKLQAQPSADGKKITLVQVNPDGTTTATQKTFDNTARGLEEAKVSFAKSIGPHDKITYLHQRATEEQQAATLAETARHNKSTEDIARENNPTKVAMLQMRMQEAAAKRAATASTVAISGSMCASACRRSTATPITAKGRS